MGFSFNLLVANQMIEETLLFFSPFPRKGLRPSLRNGGAYAPNPQKCNAVIKKCELSFAGNAGQKPCRNDGGRALPALRMAAF